MSGNPAPHTKRIAMPIAQAWRETTVRSAGCGVRLRGSRFRVPGSAAPFQVPGSGFRVSLNLELGTWNLAHPSDGNLAPGTWNFFSHRTSDLAPRTVLLARRT